MSMANGHPGNEGGGINAREHGRDAVAIYADIREHGGGKYKVHIIDLSQSGFRIKTSTHISDDRAIFLTLPGYAPLEARIAWHHGHEYGCRFISPLHEAIYEHIVKTHPSLVVQGS
ncbi:MAG: PilZ domain-containing protein [Sphingorhabdus sp.]